MSSQPENQEIATKQKLGSSEYLVYHIQFPFWSCMSCVLTVPFYITLKGLHSGINPTAREHIAEGN
jgi:hypothetical protein